MKICHWNKAVIVTVCVLLALMLPLVGVQADDNNDPRPLVSRSWICATPDNFENGACWSPIGFPQDGDDAIFDGGGTGNCNINVDTNNLQSFLMNTGYTGTVSLNTYTLRVQYTNDGSSFTGLQGTFDGGSGTVLVERDLDVSSITFTLTYGTSTFEVTGTGLITGRDNDQNSFYNLKVGAMGETTSVSSGNHPRVTNGQLTLGLGTLQRSGGTATVIYLYGNQVNPFVNGGGTISLVQLSFKNNVAINIPSGTNYYHIGIQVSGGNDATLQGDITVSSQIMIGWGNPARLVTDNHDIITGSFAIGSSVYANYVDCGSSTIDVNGNVAIGNIYSYILGGTSTWKVSGDWTSQSTSDNRDMGTSNITFDGDGSTQTITVANIGREEFHNVTIGNGASMDLSSDLNISGSFGNGSDDGDIDLGSYEFIVGTNWDSSSTDLLITRGTSTVNFTGIGTLETRTPMETYGLYNVTVGYNGAITTLVSDLGIYGRLVALGGTNPIRWRYVYLYGTEIDPPFLNNGIFSWPTGSRIWYEGSSQTVHSTTYSHLILGHGDGDAYVLEGDVTTESDLSILAISGVSSLATLTTNGYNLTIDRDFTLGHVSASNWNGALVASSSTIDIGRDVKIRWADSYITATTATFNVTRDWLSSSTSGSWDEGSSIVSFDGTDQTIDNNGQYFDKVYLNGSGDKVFINDFGARWIMGQDGTQMHLGPDTPSQSITLTFKDTNWAGFSNDPVMGGEFNSSLYINGTVTYPHTIRASNLPATTGWRGANPNWPSIGAEHSVHNLTTYNSRVWNTGHEALAQYSNVTFDQTGVACACTSDFVIWEPLVGSFFNDISINGSVSNSHDCLYIMPTLDDVFIKNFVVTNFSGLGSVHIEVDEGQDGEIVHFRNSNFDETLFDYWGGDNEEEHWISQDHNDTVGRYLIGIDWKNPVENSSISYVADGWNFGATDNVELLGGNLTIDESAIANTFTIRSNGYVEVLTGKTLSIGSNLTVDGGTLEVEGGLRTPSGTFDFYNGGGMVWLNNSTVTNANLANHYGGFNFSLGKASNSTLNHWVLEADTGDVMALNVTHERFTVGSGSVWDMNVTASTGEVLKICTKDLTSGNVYTFSINGVFGQDYTATNGWVNISFDGWSTKWLRLEGPITEPVIVPPDGDGDGERVRCDIWCILMWLLLILLILTMLYILFRKLQGYLEREVK